MSELSHLESRFRRLAELREQRDFDKETAKASEAAYREYEAVLLEEVKDSSLRGSVEFDFGDELGVIKFQPRSTTYGKIIDKKAALDSFKKLMLDEEMTGQAFEARRLNEFVRECVESGRDLPDGVGSYDRTFITISRKG